MQTTRRQFLKASYGAGSVGLLAPYCGSFAAYAQKSASIYDAIRQFPRENVTQLRLIYPQGSIENIMPVASVFTELTGIEIKYIETTVDEINLYILNSAANGGSDFDIALPATFGIPDLAEAGAIADVSAYAAIYEKMTTGEASLYALGDSYKGKKYGYQTDGDVYLMFYNNQYLDDPQLTADYEDHYGTVFTLPKSWSELDQMMAFVHEPSKDRFGGCMFRTPSYVLWEWWIRFHALGGFPVTDEFAAATGSEAGIKALEDILRMSAFQHPSVAQNGLFDNWRIYGEGKCFANIGWGGTQKYLNSDKSSVKGALSYAPTPEVSYFNWGWDYVVSEFSEHRELSYLFCLLASQPETSLAAVRENGFFDPFRAEHYEDPVIQKVYSKPFLKAHRAGMENAIPDFYMEGQGRYLTHLRENIASALTGVITPELALKFTDLQWDKLTEEIGVERQIEQWKLLKSSYPAP